MTKLETFGSIMLTILKWTLKILLGLLYAAGSILMIIFQFCVLIVKILLIFMVAGASD